MQITLTLAIDINLDRWCVEQNQTPDDAITNAPNAIAQEVLSLTRLAVEDSDLYQVSEAATLDVNPKPPATNRTAVALLTTCRCGNIDHLQLEVLSGATVTDVLIGTRCAKCEASALRQAYKTGEAS